jgi:transposase-like protein
MMTLAEGGRAIIARERLSARVQKQMSLKAARITKRLATDETDIVTANEALTHEHVVEVTIVTQNTFLAVFASEYSFSWMHIDVSNQGLEG